MESQARNASDLEIDDDFPHSPISFEDFNNNMSNIQLMNHSPGSNYSSLLDSSEAPNQFSRNGTDPILGGLKGHDGRARLRTALCQKKLIEEEIRNICSEDSVQSGRSISNQLHIESNLNQKLERQNSNASSVGIASDWESESFDNSDGYQKSNFLLQGGMPSSPMWQAEQAFTFSPGRASFERQSRDGLDRPPPLQMQRPQFERSMSNERMSIQFPVRSQSPGLRSPHLPLSPHVVQMQTSQELNQQHQYQQMMYNNQQSPHHHQQQGYSPNEDFSQQQQQQYPAPRMSPHYSPHQQQHGSRSPQMLPPYREQSRQPQLQTQGQSQIRPQLQHSNSGRSAFPEQQYQQQQHSMMPPPPPPFRAGGNPPHSSPFMSSPRIDHAQFSPHRQQQQQQQQYSGGPGNLQRSRTPSPSTLMHVPVPPMGSHPRTTSPSPKLAITAPPEVVFQVQFKRGFNDFILSPHVMEAVSVGDFVVTESFQGTALGVVTEIITMEAFVEKRNSSVYRTQYDEEEDKRVYHILRLASPQELAQLPLKHRDEQNVFQTALRLAAEKYRLPMKISEVEFQFDRQKLTIFYTSDVRIDFREIVRELFSTFKTRIWMKKTNQSAPFHPKLFASLSLTTGVQFSQTDPPMPV